MRKQKRAESARGHRLVFRARCGWCQPLKEQLANPAALICQPSLVKKKKIPQGPPGAKAGHWQEHKGAGATGKQHRRTQLYADMEKPEKDERVHHDKCVQIGTSA